MGNMKCIIAEDEFLVRQALKSKIMRLFPDLSVVAEVDSLIQLKDALAEHQPDFIFLDIHFPDGNSIEFFREHKITLPYVIFITSYPQFALDAIRLDAVDYLLKPVEDELLQKAVNKCLKFLSQDEVVNTKAEPAIIRPVGEDIRKLMVPSQSGYYILEIQDIVRFMAEVNYTRIFMKSRPPILVAITLKFFESALKEHRFFRVHKSHIVNLDLIEKYQKTTDGGVLTMVDESVIPLSKMARTEFQERLQQNVISLWV